MTVRMDPRAARSPESRCLCSGQITRVVKAYTNIGPPLSTKNGWFGVDSLIFTNNGTYTNLPLMIGAVALVRGYCSSLNLGRADLMADLYLPLAA